jgi:hypothetical protein
MYDFFNIAECSFFGGPPQNVKVREKVSKNFPAYLFTPFLNPAPPCPRKT